MHRWKCILLSKRFHAVCSSSPLLLRDVALTSSGSRALVHARLLLAWLQPRGRHVHTQALSL